MGKKREQKTLVLAIALGKELLGISLVGSNEQSLVVALSFIYAMLGFFALCNESLEFIAVLSFY